MVDGDDGLVGTQVFKLFNHIYQQNDVWFVYGNYIKSFLGIAGSSRKIDPNIVDSGTARKQADISSLPVSHLKTFYNELFLKIPDKDLMHPGSSKYF